MELRRAGIASSERAAEILAEARTTNLARIGDRRADVLIDAAVRLAYDYYAETGSGEPDASVEGESHVVAGWDRADLAARAQAAISVALGHGPKARRQEAAYIAAAAIPALRER